MGAHWVINVYIALSAPVMPILASYWPLPRPIQPHGPRDGSHGPKRILGNPEKYRWPRNSEKSLIGKTKRAKRGEGVQGTGRGRSDRKRAFPKVE